MLRLMIACVLFESIAFADEVKPMPSEGKGGKVGVFGDEKIEVNGKDRFYRLVVPKSVDPTKPVPLVFAFHGLGDSKDIMPWYSQLNKLANEKGFILIYPNGRNRMWPLLLEWAKDDLAFFDAMYEFATKNYNIDLNRVYLTGMSNGAYFSHVIASQRPDKIAAIACHSGGLGVFGVKPIDVKIKYAVLVIHGDEDIIVKVEEGRKTRDAYKKWGHPIEYVEIPKLNHWWASKQKINDQIWKFFVDHPRMK